MAYSQKKLKDANANTTWRIRKKRLKPKQQNVALALKIYKDIITHKITTPHSHKKNPTKSHSSLQNNKFIAYIQKHNDALPHIKQNISTKKWNAARKTKDRLGGTKLKTDHLLILGLDEVRDGVVLLRRDVEDLGDDLLFLLLQKYLR